MSHASQSYSVEKAGKSHSPQCLEPAAPASSPTSAQPISLVSVSFEGQLRRMLRMGNAAVGERGDLFVKDVKGVFLEVQPARLRHCCIGCLTYDLGISLGVVFQTIYKRLRVVVLQIIIMPSGGQGSPWRARAQDSNIQNDTAHRGSPMQHHQCQSREFVFLCWLFPPA